MGALLAISRVVDAANFRIGKWLSWLILAAVIVSATNAIIRKLFDTSSNAWLELQWVLFGIVFLLCSPWTLMANEHIRIDIVNNMLPRTARNWIDVIGHAFFLLPLAIIMIITSTPFALRSAPQLGDFLSALFRFPSIFADSPLSWYGNFRVWWSALLSLGEQSMNAGGLPQWPSKSIVLIGFVLLFFQGISELIKRIAVMLGRIPDPYGSAGGHQAAAEAEAERLLSELKT